MGESRDNDTTHRVRFDEVLNHSQVNLINVTLGAIAIECTESTNNPYRFVLCVRAFDDFKKFNRVDLILRRNGVSIKVRGSNKKKNSCVEG
jgi:hypothetical protein